MKRVSREQAEAEVKSLPLNSHLGKFIKALRPLISQLLPRPMEEDFDETELCSRFVEPFLSGLFDDPDNDTYLRWTNESTLEAKSVGESSSRLEV